MIIDTTVLVDFFRGREKTKEYLINADENLALSRISWMELVCGARNKIELLNIKKQLEMLNIEMIEINEDISQKASLLFEKYYHSNGLSIPDAFIAAQAIIINERLTTHNIKHFKFIEDLKVLKPY